MSSPKAMQKGWRIAVGVQGEPPVEKGPAQEILGTVGLYILM